MSDESEARKAKAQARAQAFVEAYRKMTPEEKAIARKTAAAFMQAGFECGYRNMGLAFKETVWQEVKP